MLDGRVYIGLLGVVAVVLLHGVFDAASTAEGVACAAAAYCHAVYVGSTACHCRAVDHRRGTKLVLAVLAHSWIELLFEFIFFVRALVLHARGAYGHFLGGYLLSALGLGYCTRLIL